MELRGVAFSGKKGSGKSSVARTLVDAAQAAGVQAEVFSFAAPLKQMTYEVMQSLDPSFPQGSTTWAHIRRLLGIRRADWKYRYRRQLQALGQAGREQDPEMWVKLAVARVDRWCTRAGNPCIAVIDDLRHVNEADALKQRGFALVRLVPTDATWRARGIRDTGDSHISEVALDQYRGFDEVITVTPDMSESHIVQMLRPLLVRHPSLYQYYNWSPI
jgi:hypothetical protein